MSALAEIDALIADAKARHQHEMQRLFAYRERVAADSSWELEGAEWLSRAEVSRMSPRRSTEAIRRAISRAKQVDEPETRKRGKSVLYARAWLEKNRICPVCPPSLTVCPSLSVGDP